MKKLLVFAVLILATNLRAGERSGFGLDVLVDEQMRPEYSARGNVYVEAVRGADYSLRITNPTPYRVGVALSVDGLNTIDAKHTDPRNAAKWILEPYESTVISGWQVSSGTARRFFFTGEKNSYGASLGQTDNLGVIEAVFYRERQRPIAQYESKMQDSAKAQRGEVGKDSSGLGASRPPSAAPAPSDEYAGTGMGNNTRHDIERIDIDLEATPAASVRIRYEFHQQLVKLGVLPNVTPLDRRERAQGFCPVVR